MAVSQKNINEMYQRALAAVATVFTDLPANSAGAEAANGLRAGLAKIVQADGSKTGFEGTAQAATDRRAAARKDIREYLTLLAKTAETIARKNPGFQNNFPFASDKTDAELLAAARAVTAKAAEHSTDFIRLGLTGDFIESGNERIFAFEDALAATNEALSSRGAAVGGKTSAHDEAEDHFEELNRYILNHYRDQPDKIAAWKIATHVEKSPKAKKDEPDATRS